MLWRGYEVSVLASCLSVSGGGGGGAMTSPMTESYEATSPLPMNGDALGREATRDELLATLAQMAERIQMLEATQRSQTSTMNQDVGRGPGLTLPFATPPQTPARVHSYYGGSQQARSPHAAGSDGWSEANSQWHTQHWETQ